MNYEENTPVLVRNVHELMYGKTSLDKIKISFNIMLK